MFLWGCVCRPAERKPGGCRLVVRIALLAVVAGCGPAAGEPVVIDGATVPWLLGTAVHAVRVTDLGGNAIPFQVDEMIGDSEYVCDRGEEPNVDSTDGVLDSDDEIVFLYDDASRLAADSVVPDSANVLLVERGGSRRAVRLIDNPTMALSPRRYIAYDHATQTLETNRYMAVFGSDRFHFIRAGIRDSAAGRYLVLTNELRVEIGLRLFWGLIPVRYTEENIYCIVKRYKVGPVRLIRRGDFHLHLGLGIKGSRAAVNQICYPGVVTVPVRVHLPVRFRSFFREAYIEMTPVINDAGAGFGFSVPRLGVHMPFDTTASVDTLVPVVPQNTFFSVDNDRQGYGWLLETSIDRGHLEGSGYLFVSPSPRGGIGHCGLRLGLTDLPKGYYTITNWVLFASHADGLRRAMRRVIDPARVRILGGGGETRSRIGGH